MIFLLFIYDFIIIIIMQSYLFQKYFRIFETEKCKNGSYLMLTWTHANGYIFLSLAQPLTRMGS